MLVSDDGLPDGRTQVERHDVEPRGIRLEAELVLQAADQLCHTLDLLQPDVERAAGPRRVLRHDLGRELHLAADVASGVFSSWTATLERSVFDHADAAGALCRGKIDVPANWSSSVALSECWRAAAGLDVRSRVRALRIPWPASSYDPQPPPDRIVACVPAAALRLRHPPFGSVA